MQDLDAVELDAHVPGTGRDVDPLVRIAGVGLQRLVLLEPGELAPVERDQPGQRLERGVGVVGLPAAHLGRAAVVYVRQSTPQQVLDHKESTARQYALADRDVALGWTRDRVTTIDDDLGKSGQSIEGRPGFQRLLEVVFSAL